MEGPTCIMPLQVVLLVVALHTLTALGDITVSVTPTNPVRDEKVSIECILAVPEDVKPDTCRTWWTRTVYHIGRHRASEGISASTNTRIYTMFDSDTGSYRSVIIIQQMTESVEGSYTCHLKCPHVLDSAHVELAPFKPALQVSALASMGLIGSCILSVLIVVLCIKRPSPCECIKNCTSSPRHSGTTDSGESYLSPSNSSDTSSYSTVSCEFFDAPPRYSLAVEASPDGRVQTLLRGPQRPSIYSIAFVDTPPPDYAQALDDLQKKGIFFNSALLEPMPPAYSDVKKMAKCYPLTQEV